MDGPISSSANAIGRTLSEPEVDGSKLVCVSAKTSAKGLGVRSPFRIVGKSCCGVLLSRPFERRDFVRAARGDVASGAWR